MRALWTGNPSRPQDYQFHITNRQEIFPIFLGLLPKLSSVAGGEILRCFPYQRINLHTPSFENYSLGCFLHCFFTFHISVISRGKELGGTS